MAKRKKEDFDWQDEEQEEIILVSKSEIKRDAEALKKLGEKLVDLTKAKLDKIPLEDALLEAVNLAQRLQKEARRRQLQYIGKLLRDELVAKGDDALTDFLTDYPQADRQHLRNLIRTASKEKEQNKPAKAYREIFQYLKEIVLED